MLSRAFADYGDVVRASQLHENLVQMSSTNYVGHLNVALSAIGIGEEEEAMQRLERAFDEREMRCCLSRTFTGLRRLEKTARYKRLLSDIGGASVGGAHRAFD